jgi:2-oxoglutarate-Fe(II)-dependent dioxygenase family protein
VSDASAYAVAAWHDDIWASLTSRGYALAADEAIGFPKKFRENFGQTYFNDQVLHHDDGDVPVDRKRARDVIRYRWRDGELEMDEHETITITDRAGISGKRDHSRAMLLDDPQAEDLIRSFLGLVPPGRRRSEGTFGVNLFRTFTDVVTKPHHDDEEFIFLYVLDRIGEGAESYLYLPEDVSPEGQPTAKPVFRHQLDPGEILVFEDKAFKHGATNLVPGPDGITQRDVLVCTVDYPETYLGARAVN